MSDTIFALSSGSPPAAIAVMRISGPQAFVAAERLAGALPPPRHAALRALRDGSEALLDRALVLVFEAPATATGENLVELHLHGGRAVVAAVEQALQALPGLRPAVAGEFTRQALANGRIDLAQAHGLADLLAAETEAARRAAVAATEGNVGREVRGWFDEIAAVAALIEASLDFSDEDDVDARAFSEAQRRARSLATRISAVLAQPSVERLNRGPRIVLAGPPNAGKSALFNALIEREAAIVTPVPGTTRDVIEAGVVRNGRAYLLCDTAGERDATDPVERIGIERARRARDQADLTLWLGDNTDAPAGSVKVHARMDIPGRNTVPEGSLGVAINDTRRVAALWEAIEARFPGSGLGSGLALREAQRKAANEALQSLSSLVDASDPLLAAEDARAAGSALGKVLGVDTTEAMLDQLFARFCIGK